MPNVLTRDPATGRLTEVFVASGGGAVVKMVEFDVGVVARDQFDFTVTDAAILAASRVVVNQAGEASTGRQADENEMEHFMAVGIPAAGSMRVSVNALAGALLQGKHRIYYTIG